MSIQLSGNGTRGSNVSKLPGFAWQLLTHVMTLNTKLGKGKLLHLTTIGSKSGKERTVSLRYFPDGIDLWLIVALFGGAIKHPAWYFNMAKNPDNVWVQIGEEKIKVRGESLVGQERAEKWKMIVTAAPSYGKYGAKTDREIPIVRLQRA